MAPPDALSQENILDLAVKAIQPVGDGQPSLKTQYEAVALIGHACMTAVDFRLIGLDEDHNLETSTDTASLPAEWNANDTFAFRYAYAQSSMQYLLKVSRLGNNAVIFALALGDDRTSSFDIPTKDYISASALPLSSSENITASLRDIFISPARLGDLVNLFKINVIQKLAPGLYKEGYEDPSQPAGTRLQEERQPDILQDGSLPRPARPRPFDDPLAAAPQRSNPPDFAPPGFEDELDINRPPRGYPVGFGGRGPYNIGERDLYPAGLGPNDPLRGSMGPGFGPGGGGMHPTFDDPLFGGRGAGNGGYDPRAPPGARYDPVGPGEPPVGRNRGPFGNNGQGGGGFGGFGGGFGGDII
ncbi:Proteasome Inhibitor PI31 [Penicillium cf. griseofulvum]|uniref:Proteasome Inhibitor PI31 n=1 Tax=Penicillium cf. griseofulvum TaxID=2972120 RepID=A0A9W9MG92_9EURO|nr:Proteasome Inhibitor PI31 [Penicillium cf. griseofulvum]KAJ5423234.1 Proteasome Inhibitor PI31 [Penicillium cf. griseofulvum]KAJ5431493.1 Proteasome Inhibitor PI31 [Penicillium cf. griseofulvum]